jgi:hypothetical protein
VFPCGFQGGKPFTFIVSKGCVNQAAAAEATPPIHHLGTRISVIFPLSSQPIHIENKFLLSFQTSDQLKEYLSSSHPVRYGVPQGSVLGPLLFILYINGMLHLTQGRTIMYADDTSILNINELQKTAYDNTGLVEQY